MNAQPRVGVVAIGRNEGERLRACLTSVVGKAHKIIYVDSGSSDDSVNVARTLGAEVVELDLSTPFTAARARNAGFERARECEFVYFVDGDCETAPGWIELASSFLAANPKWAIVCGRRRERFPAASKYNRLCDIEWNTPIGRAKSCGGDAMIRSSVFQQVGGFNPTIIAGEEPEMCVRLRLAGWEIHRLHADMTLHDASMTRFSQWWKRNVRAGHAYAEGAALHGKSTGFRCKENRSNWLWGLILPIGMLILAWPTRGWSLAVLLIGYVILWMRVRSSARKRSFSSRDANLYAFFTVLGKFPQMFGQLKYCLGRLRGKPTGIIEYKSAARATS